MEEFGKESIVVFWVLMPCELETTRRVTTDIFTSTRISSHFQIMFNNIRSDNYSRTSAFKLSGCLEQ
jgi:hypothetical protein